MKNLNNLSLEQIDRLIAKKQAMQRNHPSGLESFGRAALNTATLGFAPKIAGAIGALGARAIRPELFEDENFGQTYQQARNAERQNIENAEISNPNSSLAGSLLGSLTLPFPAKTIKGAAGLGAVYGAGQGIGHSDFGEPGSLNAEDLISGLYNASLGGVLGGASQGLINKFFP